MPRRPLSSSARLLAAATLFGLLCAADAGDRRKPTITKPAYDPSAREVDLFEAIEAGQLDVKMIPKDSKGGNLLIENKSDEPLTVKMPQAFVGVHVHKQIGGGLGGGGLGGLGGGGLGGGLGGQGGGAQALGGGLGGGGLGGGGLSGGGGLGGAGLGGGGGFFSVPAETIARIPFQSVCLEYGKTEPTSRMPYEIRPVSDFTEDPTLQQLIGLVGSGRVDLESAQAAAWHLSSGMSWEKLATLENKHLGGVASEPYFAPGKIAAAQTLVSAAAAKAREVAANDETPADPAATPKPAPARRPIR